MTKMKSNALQMAARQKAKSASDAAAHLNHASMAKLQERAMLVRLAHGRWYGAAADEQVVAEVRDKANAKGDVGVFTKRLMERQHLAAINAVVNDARKYHRAMTLSWADPFRILSAELFMDYRATMAEYEAKFEKAVREFLMKFDDLKEQEKKRLGKLYREADYPSREVLRSRFYVKLRFEPIPDADDFRVRLGGDDIKVVREQIEQEVASNLREATMEIWKRMQELVKKLSETLKDSDASVRGALFQNLKDIVSIMPKLNLTGDKKLEAITQRVQKELLAEDVEAVKDDDKLRASVAKKADDILDAMSSFIGPQE